MVKMSHPPYTIKIYDSDFRSVGRVGDPLSVRPTIRHNKSGAVTVSVSGDHAKIPKLIADGARVSINDWDTDQVIISGWVDRIRGTGPRATSTLEFDIDDDFRVLLDALGWVLPASAITAQGSGARSWRQTGPAESVIKAAVQANIVDRLGLPLVCAPDLGRGATITADIRFEPLYDALFPITDGAGAEKAGIGISVVQQGDHLVLDAYVPRTVPRVVSEASGALLKWSYTKQAATVTDVVVGGPGEDQLRVFRTMQAAGRIATLGRRLERFRDARDVAADDPDLIPKLYERGQQTIDDGAEKVGLSLTLAATRNFSYGKIGPGDIVTLRLDNGIEITQPLTELSLDWSRDDGFTPTPKIGDIQDSTDGIIASAIRRLARSRARESRG